MAHIDVSATAMWPLTLDIVDDEGPVDMTGKTCAFVVSKPDNTEICRAVTWTGATGSGTIVIVEGPSDTGGAKSRLQVSIPAAAHASFIVSKEYLFAEGELGIFDDSDWLWLGAVDLKVWAGPTWTGASGATGA